MDYAAVQPTKRARAVRWLAILGVNVFAAFCFVGIKLGLVYAPPLVFGGLRALLAGLALLMVAVLAKQPIRPARGDLLTIALLALTATTITYGAMFGSPALMAPGLASVLGNVQPLLVLGLGIIVLGEPITSGKLIAAVAGLAGVIMLLSPAFAAGSIGTLMGGGLALTASAGAAVGSIVFKRARLRIGLVATTGWQLVLGSVPLLAAGLFVSGMEPSVVRWTPTFVALLAILALLGTALPTTLWFWLLRGEDAGRLSMFLFLIPVLGLGLGMAAFGERVSLLQTAGVLTIALGLLAILREKAHVLRTVG